MHDFAEQVAALRPVLVRIAQNRLRNHAWAEDAVSETVVAALENPRACYTASMLRPWLVGILKHKMADQVRRHMRECQVSAADDEAEFDALADAAASSGVEAPAEWGDPQERLSRRQFMTQLDQCLQALPAQQSRAFLLRDGMEHETDDICSELGVTANHLGVMLHRARSRLRTLLQTQWVPAAGPLQTQPQA
jgi:RNA polymerase sigma-70 factor, ECF subfamily